MLRNKMTTITTPEESYPVICTLNVLEYIQNKYGTIAKFEQLVSGMMPDEKDDEGKEKYKYTPINVAALLDGLTVMINEGLDIKGAETNESGYLPFKSKYVARIIRDAEISLADAAGIVLTELSECILPKNVESARGKQIGRRPKLTSRGSSLLGKIFSTIRKKK